MIKIYCDWCAKELHSSETLSSHTVVMQTPDEHKLTVQIKLARDNVWNTVHIHTNCLLKALGEQENVEEASD